MNFANKVVIVTGGSSGIGASTAIAFAKEDADVVIVGRNEERLKHIADEMSKVGKKPLTIKADVSKDEDLKEIIKKTIDKYGKLDILINNAGIVTKATVVDKNLPEIYDEIMNTNLRSVVLLTNFAAPHLIKTKGNIVNISSVAGKAAGNVREFGYACYKTSKAGLDHFSRVSALELADKRVRVNVVSPGFVKTPMVARAGFQDSSAMINYNPLKVLTQPEEISDMIMYLASDKAKSITGSNFLVDSGLLMIM